MQSTAKWRPCCGKCRGERLIEQDDARPNGDHFAFCEDCGAIWDGSSLSAAEVADRPRPVRLARGGPSVFPYDARAQASRKRLHEAI